MKSIKLTEKHKSKLLEMCKILFPEYKEIYFGVNEYNDSFDCFTYFAKTKLPCKNIINIHWFELCMTHLFYELYYSGWRKENPNCVVDFHLDLHNYKTHVVDYLYKEFKKLQ